MNPEATLGTVHARICKRKQVAPIVRHDREEAVDFKINVCVSDSRKVFPSVEKLQKNYALSAFTVLGKKGRAVLRFL